VRVAEEQIPVGTEVTVILKENLLQYCRSLEYLGYLKTNVRFLPIALNFVDEKGEHTVLGQESLNYDEEIHWGTKFTTKLDFESSRGYLLLKVLENHEYIYDNLNPEICSLVEDEFRRFIRINHSRYDLLHSPDKTASDTHGYIHLWQQRVIDGYKEKGAGAARRAERQAL